MSTETKTHMTVREYDDGFNEPRLDDRLIQGELLKCNVLDTGNPWRERGGTPVAVKQFLVLATTTVVQRWKEQRPVETIKKQKGVDLPDVDELNATIPQSEWEVGFDGVTLRPPWQVQWIVYLLDPATAQRFTFASGTKGGKIAVEKLTDAVTWTRQLRSARVSPLVKLGLAKFSSRFGPRLRPDFAIVDWIGIGASIGPTATVRQLEHAVAAPATEEPAVNKYAEIKGKSALKPVKPVTTEEALDDEIPFD